jgi:hypothetical protein
MSETSLSLYQIETELLQLIEAREEAQAEGEMPETLAVIDQQIQEYFVRECRKVDGIARYINLCKTQAAVAKAEADRLATWARRWENRLERVKAATVYALGAVGLKKVESAENRLRLQKNPASVEVYDVALLPDEYIRVTYTLPLPEWKRIRTALGESESAAWPRTDVDKRAIAEALKRGEQIQGARWAEPSEHLRCE